MKKLLLVSVLAVLCSACSITTHYVQTNAKTYPPTNPDEVKVYANSEVLDGYTVIGSVATFAPGNAEKAVEELREEAANMGANAIIAFQLDKLNSFGKATEASGTAVRID